MKIQMILNKKNLQKKISKMKISNRLLMNYNKMIKILLSRKKMIIYKMIKIKYKMQLREVK